MGLGDDMLGEMVWWVGGSWRRIDAYERESRSLASGQVQSAVRCAVSGLLLSVDRGGCGGFVCQMAALPVIHGLQSARSKDYVGRSGWHILPKQKGACRGLVVARQNDMVLPWPLPTNEPPAAQPRHSGPVVSGLLLECSSLAISTRALAATLTVSVSHCLYIVAHRV